MTHIFLKCTVGFLAMVTALQIAHAEENLSAEDVRLEVAAYGCIRGMAHPGRTQLSFDDQLSACDTFVDLMVHEGDLMGARRHRGTFLAEHAITAEHRNQAFEDLSFLIENDTRRASIFRMRAILNFRDRRDPEAALSDITAAIDLSQDHMLAKHFKLRASILIHLAQTQNDKTLARRALEDVRMVRSLEPEDSGVREAEDWLIDFLGE